MAFPPRSRPGAVPSTGADADPARPRRERMPAPPLDPAALERLALRYVERFATTRGRLADYLRRKLRERGWQEGAAAPDPAALAERMATLGYVDDRAYGEGKAAAMARRGLGARRVAGALRAARVGSEDLDAIAPDVAGRSLAAALALARRRRIGPFATAPADRPQRQRQLAAMLRAGHDLALSRRIVEASPNALIDDSAGDCTHCEQNEGC